MSPTPEAGGRSAQKRQAILDAATSVFLENGYLGATMDQIAAKAAVSKQTVYKHFADKKALFTAIVEATTYQVADGIDDSASAEPVVVDDLEAHLQKMARGLIGSIMQPDVLQVRRLIIAEAARFPELGCTWYEQGFQRSLAAMAKSLEGLAAGGRLDIADPAVAANHLAGLVLWIPVNQAMFCGKHDAFTRRQLHRFADDAVAVFLNAYATRSSGH